MNPITNYYYQSVLNTSEGDPFHVIRTVEFESKRKVKDKERRMDENLRVFSFDSETPMCFVSG